MTGNPYVGPRQATIAHQGEAAARQGEANARQGEANALQIARSNSLATLGPEAARQARAGRAARD